MKHELILRIISSIILVPLSLFFIIKGSFLFISFITLCFLIASFEWHTMSKKTAYYIPGLLFLFISFLSVYYLRNSFYNNGMILFLFILIICVSTDIGGYFFGKVFKGPKLTKISPNKTYSGMIGGYFLSIFSVYILFDLKQKFDLNYIDKEFDYKVIIFIFLISTISQIGDIIISYFKRISKIKNTGKIIPGHGGLLDRIDGMVFSFPSAYVILLYFY